jgi:hypothetical protein
MTLSLEQHQLPGLAQYINPDVLAYLQHQQTRFEQCRSQLLTTYAGQFVWFEDGIVLDADIDEAELFERAMSQDANRTLFIAQVVATEPQRLVRSAFLGRI